ncbi:hypothetical protein CALCODRAFT_500310 [Calocera cornea HHB12733]|uniref:F-box domain-containing protein n=1 Tax=Calocera cornea HHB12733 TaxID=1353952 RepID=A0A165E4B7_9BASI|nr:hypothetical protein CALCODRAFT_500310 [Calocera cornea HHB12733]
MAASTSIRRNSGIPTPTPTPMPSALALPRASPSPSSNPSSSPSHTRKRAPTPTPTLPNELLSIILSFLLSLDDLLAVALASRHLYSLVLPLHLHHRSLRCRFRDDQLWKELAASPARCAAIHRLAVLDRAGDRAEYRVDWTRRERYYDRWPPGEVPGNVAPHADDPLAAIHHGSDALNKLAPSLTGLRNLTMYLPAMCFVKMRDFFREVGGRLEGCHLRVSFMHPAVTPEHRAQSALVADAMSSRLRHFSLKIEEYRSDVIERVLRSFARLLRRCDDLENLCIEVENGASTSYQCAELWRARWLKLLTLDLSGLRMEEADELDGESDADAEGSHSHSHSLAHAGLGGASSSGAGTGMDPEQPNIEQFFLALHSLQALRLDCYAPRTPTIRPDSMPSLQAVGLLGSSLEVQWAMLPTLVSPLSDGSYRPIDSLQWDLKYYPFADSRSGTVFRLFCHHLAKAARLRQTMLVRSAYGTESFPWVREFGKAVPGIRHLVIDPDGIMSFDTWLELLAAYPCLITLNPTNNGIHQPFLKPFSSHLASLALSAPGMGIEAYDEGLMGSHAHSELGMSMSMSMGVDAQQEDRREQEMLYKLSGVCPELRHVDGWVREDLPEEAVALSAEGTSDTARGCDPSPKRYIWKKRADTSRPCERDCCRLRPPYVRERT